MRFKGSEVRSSGVLDSKLKGQMSRRKDEGSKDQGKRRYYRSGFDVTVLIEFYDNRDVQIISV